LAVNPVVDPAAIFIEPFAVIIHYLICKTGQDNSKARTSGTAMGAAAMLALYSPGMIKSTFMPVNMRPLIQLNTGVLLMVKRCG
jgi:hypothetical protein